MGGGGLGANISGPLEGWVNSGLFLGLWMRTTRDATGRTGIGLLRRGGVWNCNGLIGSVGFDRCFVGSVVNWWIGVVWIFVSIMLDV